MTALAHVFAVEVEPGWYAKEVGMYVRNGCTLMHTKSDADNFLDDIRRRTGRMYPSARVVEFALAEVTQEES
jgi:hypothetical protein